MIGGARRAVWHLAGAVVDLRVELLKLLTNHELGNSEQMECFHDSMLSVLNDSDEFLLGLSECFLR